MWICVIVFLCSSSPFTSNLGRRSHLGEILCWSLHLIKISTRFARVAELWTLEFWTFGWSVHDVWVEKFLNFVNGNAWFSWMENFWVSCVWSGGVVRNAFTDTLQFKALTTCLLNCIKSFSCSTTQARVCKALKVRQQLLLVQVVRRSFPKNTKVTSFAM